MSNRRRLLCKVCGVTRAEDAALLSELKADFTGVVFVRSSPRCLSLDEAARLPKGMKYVAVISCEELSLLPEIVAALSPAAVQLCGNWLPQQLAAARAVAARFALLFIRSVAVTADFPAHALEEEPPDYWLFDSANGGSGRRFDWRALSAYRGARPFFIAGGLDAEAAEEVQALARRMPLLAGVDASSRLECEPRVKDPERVREFVRRMQDAVI